MIELLNKDIKVYPPKHLDILEKALFVATQAHFGQVDKGGFPYIFHPIAVMSKLKSDGYHDHFILAAALLHDVFEDTEWDYTDISTAVNPIVASYVLTVTHFKAESYEEYILRIKRESVEAIAIKRADIWHNTSSERMANIPVKDRERLKLKYKKALKILAN